MLRTRRRFSPSRVEACQREAYYYKRHNLWNLAESIGFSYTRLDDLQLLLGYPETSFEFFSPHGARTIRALAYKPHVNPAEYSINEPHLSC